MSACEECGREHAEPPNLRSAETAERSCKGCRFWQQWMGEVGDCMAYAMKRRAALIEAEDMEAYRRDWPELPARDTLADDVCDDWKARE